MKITREILGSKVEFELTAEELSQAVRASMEKDVVANLRGMLETDVPENAFDDAVYDLTESLMSSDLIANNEWTAMQEVADALNKKYSQHLYEVDVYRTVTFTKTLTIRASSEEKARELAEEWLYGDGRDVDEYDDSNTGDAGFDDVDLIDDDEDCEPDMEEEVD